MRKFVGHLANDQLKIIFHSEQKLANIELLTSQNLLQYEYYLPDFSYYF